MGRQGVRARAVNWRSWLDGWFGVALKLVALLAAGWAGVQFVVRQADEPFHSDVTATQREIRLRLDDLHEHAIRVEQKQERADQWERCRSAELAEHQNRALAESRCDERYPPITGSGR